ncbi:MAG: cupin [Deltaproteobacteria bacterium]|nr:cupin [Deltaproteobacteria bacterium]
MFKTTETKRGDFKRVPKPWGYEIWWAITDKYVGKILHVNKDHSLSYQYHKVKDETIYVYSGEIILELEEVGRPRERIRLLPGDARRITPLTKHRMTAVEESDLIEVSTPEVDDLIRLEDNYGRV